MDGGMNLHSVEDPASLRLHGTRRPPPLLLSPALPPPTLRGGAAGALPNPHPPPPALAAIRQLAMTRVRVVGQRWRRTWRPRAVLPAADCCRCAVSPTRQGEEGRQATGALLGMALPAWGCRSHTRAAGVAGGGTPPVCGGIEEQGVGGGLPGDAGEGEKNLAASPSNGACSESKKKKQCTSGNSSDATG